MYVCMYVCMYMYIKQELCNKHLAVDLGFISGWVATAACFTFYAEQGIP